MGPPKILLVDDNRPVLNCRQTLLEQAGFCVRAADSGLSALRIAETERPDVVVTDIRMAGMDGYEVCRKVRALYDVPVILYSAYDIDQEHRDAARDVGAAVVMTSACQVGELIEVIQRLLCEKEEIQPIQPRFLAQTAAVDAPSPVPEVPYPSPPGSQPA